MPLTVIASRAANGNQKLIPVRSRLLQNLEAKAIRALFDRIKYLEDQVNILKSSSCLLKTTESETTQSEKNKLSLSSDRLISEFLDGAGI